MSIARVMVDGQEYPIAPMEPQKCDHPGPSYPVTVTPEVARHWLRYNYVNRPVREDKVKDYGADMSRRDFGINGAAIGFSRPYRALEHEDVPEGQVAIMDGQHRLLACAAGTTPIVTYVTYGLNPDLWHTIDTNIKRKLSDALRKDGEVSIITLASVIMRCHAWESGNQRLDLRRNTKTHSQLLDFFHVHPEIRRSTQISGRTAVAFKDSTGQSMRKSVPGLAHWLFMQVDEATTPEFFARLGDGAMMPSHDPLMTLRRRLVKDLTVRKQVDGDSRRRLPRVEDWEYLCYFIRTWNARLHWLLLPEEKQQTFTFAPLSHRDNGRIPEIKTPQQVLDEMSKRLAREDVQNA